MMEFIDTLYQALLRSAGPYIPIGKEIAVAVLTLLIMLYGVYIVCYPALPKGRYKNPVSLLISTLWGAVKGIFRMIGMLAGSLLHFLTGVTRNAGKSPLGSAHFLQGIARWRVLRRGHGGVLIDGKRAISLTQSYRGICVLGGTGSGKSTIFSIPNLLAAHMSFVATDPSGELEERSSGALLASGYRIQRFDPHCPGSALFNPLWRIHSHKDAQMVAQALIQTAYPASKGDSSFWNSSAENLLTVLIRALKTCGDERVCHLGSVRHLLNSIGTTGEALDPFIASTGHHEILSEWQGITSNSDKVLASIVATARQSLGIFSDANVRRLTAADTLDFSALRSRRTALFIRIPEAELSYFQPLVALLYGQLFQFAMEMPRPADRDILFLVEEAGNSGRIPDLEVITTTIRKRRCSICLILQDPAQMTRWYGAENAKTILGGGMQTQVFLPGLDIDVCKKIEAMLGRGTVTVEDPETGRRQTMARPLLDASEIRTLSEREGIMISGNKHPVRLRTTPYYKHFDFKRLAYLSPYAPPEAETEGDAPLVDLRAFEELERGSRGTPPRK